MPDIETTMENRDKKNALNALIDRRMKEAEQLAEAGRVNESEQLIKEIEQLKEQQDDQDNMICEICGAMQSATDTERRTVSHLEGKQHKGFAAIRKCIEDLKSHKDLYRHIDVTKPINRPNEKNKEEESKDKDYKSRDYRDRRQDSKNYENFRNNNKRRHSRSPYSRH